MFNSGRYRIGKFAAAYQMAVVRRDVAIGRIMDVGRKESDAQDPCAQAYRGFVDSMTDIISPTIDYDKDGFRRLDIRIIRNKLKTRRFEMMKAKAIGLKGLEAARCKLIADIDAVLRRAKRVHLTYRALRVYQAKKK
jgi:hypothetical protein